MTPLRALLLATILAALACASTGRAGADPVDAGLRLQRGLALLDAGDHRGAAEVLEWIYSHCHPHATGRTALLTLAAVELDPRNPYRRIDAGADLAARYLAHPTAEPWARPVAASLYLMARELGGAVVDDTADRSAPGPGDAPVQRLTTGRAEADAAVTGCGEPPTSVAATAIPELPGPPMAAYVLRINEARQRLESRLDSLVVEADTLRETLAAREQELERIRRTLQP